MNLKAVVENLDAVPEERRHLYIEQDGRFVLDVDDLSEHPAVEKLARAFQRNVVSFHELLCKAEEVALKKKHAATVAALDKEVAEKREWVHKHSIDAALRAELSRGGVTSPAFLKAVTAMLRDRIEFSTNMDWPQLTARTRTGRVPLRRYIESWLRSEEGKHFVDERRQPAAPGSFAAMVDALK